MRKRAVGVTDKEKRIKRKEVGGERRLSAHFGVINLKNPF